MALSGDRVVVLAFWLAETLGAAARRIRNVLVEQVTVSVRAHHLLTGSESTPDRSSGVSIDRPGQSSECAKKRRTFPVSGGLFCSLL